MGSATAPPSHRTRLRRAPTRTLPVRRPATSLQAARRRASALRWMASIAVTTVWASAVRLGSGGAREPLRLPQAASSHQSQLIRCTRARAAPSLALRPAVALARSIQRARMTRASLAPAGGWRAGVPGDGPWLAELARDSSGCSCCLGAAARSPARSAATTASVATRTPCMCAMAVEESRPARTAQMAVSSSRQAQTTTVLRAESSIRLLPGGGVGVSQTRRIQTHSEPCQGAALYASVTPSSPKRGHTTLASH